MKSFTSAIFAITAITAVSASPVAEPDKRPCPVGQVRNPNTHQCVNICSTGYHFNKFTNKCDPDCWFDEINDQTKGGDCFLCLPGTHADKSRYPEECASNCPPGYTFNPETYGCDPVTGTKKN